LGGWWCAIGLLGRDSRDIDIEVFGLEPVPSARFSNDSGAWEAVGEKLSGL
jgi:hypothetical protein